MSGLFYYSPLRIIFPELVLGRETETGRLNIISTESWQTVAYVYHRKWVFKATISDYAMHIGAIISLLEQWDGETSTRITIHPITE